MPKETRRLHRVAEHVGAAASSSAAAAQQQDEEELVMAELLSRVSSLDAATYKANRLTDEEREFYEREGYLVVPGAIDSAADLAELQGLLGQMREENLAAGKANPTQRVNKAAFSVTNHRLFSASDAMVRLLTNPKVFPKVVDMLGINISLYHVQINTVPPGEESEEPDWSMAPTLGFHQDSGRSNVELEVPAGVARPRLTLKAGYMLTDLRPTGRGQTWLIPKSHTAHGREDIAGWPADGVGQPPGAFPFRAAPGDCVICEYSRVRGLPRASVSPSIYPAVTSLRRAQGTSACMAPC